MYKIEFTLKQHTPLIHFQHDQAGATLRATEVKPKLDRFIIEKLTGKTGNEAFTAFKANAEWKKWLVGNGEHPALDYKVRIEPNNKSRIEIKERHQNSPMYFANMGKTEEEKSKFKHFKFIKDDIECAILSFNTLITKIDGVDRNLLEIINDSLYVFFFQNNFGTRQSKGYGSFEVIKINNVLLDQKLKKKFFNYKIALNNASNWEIALTQVSYFYKALRGGINIVNQPQYSAPNNSSKAVKLIKTSSSYYIKPLIFLYAKSLGQQWDKKTIKQYYLNTNFEYRKPTKRERDNFGNIDIEEYSLREHLKKYSSPDILFFNSSVGATGCYYDFKDLLGLSSEESWKSYGKTIIKENVASTSTSSSISPIKKKDPSYIDRFKSPIFFKIIQENNSFYVYLIFHDIPTEYAGSKYSVFPRGISSNLVIEIPNFQMTDFFNYIKDATLFNFSTYLPTLKKYTGTNEREIEKYNELENINATLRSFLTQIQNQSNNAK